VSPRGVVVPPGEASSLVSAIERLVGNTAERARLGAAGREFAQAVLSRDAVLSDFEAKLCALRADASGSSALAVRRSDS
jgi:colanic acid biosynthesis glycosyl transferase WcaI